MSGIWQGGGASGLAFAVGSDNAKAARPGDAAVAAAPAAVVPARVPPPYQDWMLPKVKEIRDRRNIDDPQCALFAGGRAAHHQRAAAHQDHPDARTRSRFCMKHFTPFA